MKNSGICPKCGSRNVVRIPDTGRYASSNSIYTTRATLFGKIPVIRYVCCSCGFVENWSDPMSSNASANSSDKRKGPLRRAFVGL